MKPLLTAAFLIISLPVFCQGSYQVTDTSKVWNTLSYGVATEGFYVCGGTTSCKMGEEVNIGDDLYFEVLESEDSLQLDWNTTGYLREDTVNHVVYYARSVDEVGLIYDFNIDVGDTVNIFNYHILQGFDATLICFDIDTVTIFDHPRKRYSFYENYIDPENPDEVWIEGIGSLYGVLNSGIGGSGFVGGGFDLLCCSQNDSMIYMYSYWDSCYIDYFYPQIIQESYDTAYLNTYYEFQVQIDTGNAESFMFWGEMIPEGFEFDPYTGLLTGFPADTGSFLCIVFALNDDWGGWLSDFLISNIPVVMPANIREPANPSGITIYPNPCGKTLFIEDNSFNADNCHVEVFSPEGILIDKKTILENAAQIDVSNYHPGLYLIKITGNNNDQVKLEKVIIK